MKFINKHAYIITGCYYCFDGCLEDICIDPQHLCLHLISSIFAAIFAYSFCHAARKAFFLLLRNILRVSAVSMVSGFVLLIGKVPP